MRTTVSVIALIASLGAAQAQDTPLDKIVVSANRTPTGADHIGSSVTVITAEDLEKTGEPLLSDFLARQASLTVTQAGAPGGVTNIRIRGAEQRYTAVYIDGIRVDDPGADKVAYDFGSLTTADIGRVEILRGSQSALYGGSAVGGVINITTKRPTRDGFTQSLAAEAGSEDTRRLGYTLGFRQGALETSLSASHLKSDGFSAYDTLPRTNGLEDDGLEVNRLTFSSRYQVNAALAIGGTVFRQNANNEYDGYLADAANVQKRDETGGRLFAELRTGTTTHLFDVTRYRQDREDIGANPGEVKAKRTGLSYQGTTEVTPNLTLVYGADTMQEETSGPAMPNGEDTRVSGAYLQALWAIGSDVDLSATIRQDDNSRYGDFTSGRVAAAWRPLDGLVIRAAAARGFRAPSLYEQYGDVRFQIGPNADLAPEKSRSYELGADYTFANGATVGATVFKLDIDNAISYCSPFDPCSVTPPEPFDNKYENRAGFSKRSGIEVAANVPVTDDITVGGTYTYTDARNPSDARLARVPYHNLGLSADAKLTDSLSGHLALHHVADVQTTSFEAPLEDYTVVNAGLSYALADGTSLTLRVQNLFDEEHQTVPDYGTQGRAAYVGIRKSW